MTGLAEVVSRVQQLQSMLARPPAGATQAGSAGFASALSEAQATGAATATGTDPDTPTGEDVVAAARRYLGVPYVWGGTDPASGLDCSGLVQRVYADLGIDLPRVSRDQAKAGRAVTGGLAAAQPGDVLAFGQPVHHVGIYLGNGMMLDAPKPGDQVKIQRVWETPSAIRRMLPEGGPAATAAGPAAEALMRPASLGGAAAAGVPYAGLFQQATAKYGLPPALLAAVAKVESGYDPAAVSPAGARGLMQIMPGTAADLGVDPLVPAQAVDGAARLLSRHLDTFGSLPLALAAYNAGPGAVRRYGGVPPYAETQAYVGKVQTAMSALSGGSR